MLAGGGVPPLASCAACPGFRARERGSGWPRGAVSGADRVGAGQAAASGGPQAASQRLRHSCSRCQPSGRWRTRWPRPCRAVRAATAIRSRRIVAARAFAQGRLARRRRRGGGCAPWPRQSATRR